MPGSHPSRRRLRRARLTSALAALIALAACAGAHAATPTDASSGPLRWAPPKLHDPTTIRLGTGPTVSNLDPHRDYIVKLPATRKVGSTVIDGGHNVVIIGGYVTVPASASEESERRAIYIDGATGTVHIEGVKIDSSGGGESDAIDINAPEATVQLENIRVDGIHGSYDGTHADLVQPWGGVRDLRIDHFTGFSDYQGLQIDPDLGRIGSAQISNVNLIATPPRTPGEITYLVWLSSGDESCRSYPVEFSNVYVRPLPGRTLASTVWPPRNQLACHESGEAFATWEHLPIVGGISRGSRKTQDFVPPGTAGVGYRSPGYRG